MRSLSLNNFKSYENQTLAKLNPHINIFIGANGDGKSNLLKGR